MEKKKCWNAAQSLEVDPPPSVPCHPFSCRPPLQPNSSDESLSFLYVPVIFVLITQEEDSDRRGRPCSTEESCSGWRLLAKVQTRIISLPRWFLLQKGNSARAPTVAELPFHLRCTPAATELVIYINKIQKANNSSHLKQIWFKKNFVFQPKVQSFCPEPHI